jgi:hypothetical protein
MSLATLNHTLFFKYSAPLFCPILIQYGFSLKDFHKVSNIKLHENQSGGTCADAHRQMDKWTDGQAGRHT